MRYRDLETGTFITRDPMGFVDGPNMYAYVVQNPWTFFDPLGLQAFKNNKTGEWFVVNPGGGQALRLERRGENIVAVDQSTGEVKFNVNFNEATKERNLNSAEGEKNITKMAQTKRGKTKNPEAKTEDSLAEKLVKKIPGVKKAMDVMDATKDAVADEFESAKKDNERINKIADPLERVTEEHNRKKKIPDAAQSAAKDLTTTAMEELSPLDQTRNADPEMNKKAFDKAKEFTENPVETTVQTIKDAVQDEDKE